MKIFLAVTLSLWSGALPLFKHYLRLLRLEGANTLLLSETLLFLPEKYFRFISVGFANLDVVLCTRLVEDR